MRLRQNSLRSTHWNDAEVSFALPNCPLTSTTQTASSIQPSRPHGGPFQTAADLNQENCGHSRRLRRRRADDEKTTTLWDSARTKISVSVLRKTVTNKTNFTFLSPRTISYPFSSLFPFPLLRSSSLLISSPLPWDSDSIFWPEFPFLPFSLYLLTPL